MSAPLLLQDLDRAARLAADGVEVHDHRFGCCHAAQDTVATRDAREHVGLRAVDRGGETAEVLVARHVDGAERLEVRRRPLHVEQRGAAVAHQVDEPDDRDLRRVALAVELRLRGEQPTDRHSVEPTREFTVAPHLDAVRPSEAMQRDVRVDELVVDPTVWSSRVRATAHHFLERGVDA